MTDREVMQQALEALAIADNIALVGAAYTPKSIDLGLRKIRDSATALRAALEQQAEPVSHAVIAGALFDFMGWLTTRKERLVLSSTDNASPAVESITEFAKMRGLSLDDAKVQDWNTSLPQQQAEPVAWDKPSTSFNEWWDSYRHDPANPFAEGSAAYWAWAGWKSAQRQWVGLTGQEKDMIARVSVDVFEAMYRAEAKLKERNHDR